MRRLRGRCCRQGGGGRFKREIQEAIDAGQIPGAHWPSVRANQAIMRPMTSTPIVYGIANCDTVKKARAWLQAQNVAYAWHDFKKQGVPAALLAQWTQQLGRDALINRKGTTWRRLDAAAQASVTDDASAQALMLAQPSVIKRPVVDWGEGKVTVGFNAQTWAQMCHR